MPQPWWENGAAVFWIIVAVALGTSWVVSAWRGRDD